MPSPDSNPQFNGPDDHPADDFESEVDDGSVSPIEEAEGLLLDLFETRALNSDWDEVDPDLAQELAPEWEKHIFDRFIGETFELQGNDGSIPSVNLQAFGQDESSYFVLASISDANESARYYISDGGIPVKLADNATCAYLVTIPKFTLEDDDADEFEGYSLFVDEMSLEIEAKRFESGDFGGLIGCLLREDIERRRIPFGILKDVRMGILADSEITPSTSFHLQNDRGERFYFEASSDPGLGFLHTIGPLPLSTDGLVPDTSVPHDDLTPAFTRKRLLASLEESGLREVPMASEALSTRVSVFELDLPGFFDQWKAPTAWKLKVESVHVPNDVDEELYLVEVSVRSADESYLLPTLNGSGTLRSSSPLSLFFEAAPRPHENDLCNFGYRLRMIALPPEIGLRPVVVALIRNPQQSLIIRAIERSIAHELNLDLPEAQALRVDSIVVIPEPEAPQRQHDEEEEGEEEAIDDDDSFSERNLALMCFHNLGASVVVLQNDRAGLMDLGAISAVHFFRGLPPL